MPPSLTGGGLRVLSLYKQIMRLHQAMEPEMRSIGDAYVRSEFRAHRGASEAQLHTFERAWRDYATLLQVQSGAAPGRDLTAEEAAAMSPEQRTALAEQEASWTGAPPPEPPSEPKEGMWPPRK